MAYTTINKSTDYFNTKTYTGNGSTQSITGVGFQPDWVWFKIRNTTGDHRVFDAVRGTEARLYTNGSQAEASPDTGTLTSFDSDGFSVGNSDVNINGSSQVSWNWKAGGSGSANTDGSISSTVSANTTSGFSIVKWTGSGANATVGHGLGVAPKMIMVKNLATADSWNVYHESIGNGKRLFLDTNGVESSTSDAWNSTSPTSSVFSIGTNTGTNNNGSNLIAYCFAEKKGFSKFGKYSGNVNLDGPFIYTGFKPAWVMIKCVGLANQSWTIFNNGLNSFNEMTNTLQANSNGAEDGNTTYNDVDFVSNGIKIREDNDNINATGQDYVYMAFAEAPIVGTNNIPATAR